MVALSFKVFKEKLLSGEKDQTIRKQNLIREEQMARLGIQAYWLQRTIKCEKLFDATLKEKIFPIKIFPALKEIHTLHRFNILRKLKEEDQIEITRRDGFDSEKDFWKFFISQYELETLRNEIWSTIRFGKAII